MMKVRKPSIQNGDLDMASRPGCDKGKTRSTYQLQSLVMMAHNKGPVLRHAVSAIMQVASVVAKKPNASHETWDKLGQVKNRRVGSDEVRLNRTSVGHPGRGPRAKEDGKVTNVPCH